MNIQEHKFTVGFIIFVTLALLPVPGQPLMSLALLYFPGVFLMSFIKKEVNTIEIVGIPFLAGMSFWIVFSYFVSELHMVHWVALVSISFLSAVVADRQHIRINVTVREFTLLLLCCLFIVSYSYPWFQFFQWIPPGDDMKYHIPHIEHIVETHSLPEAYGELYPEVDTLTYTLGYHSVISIPCMFSGVSFPSIMIPTLFIVSLACFSFYFLGNILFNERVGLYSAFSLSFLSLFFHRLLSTSTYPNLLGITLQVFAFYLLCETLQKKSAALIMISALAIAAAGMTHPYVLLLNVLVLSFLIGGYAVKKEGSKGISLLSVGVISSFLCIPYILRLHPQPPSTVELWTFTVWYTEDSIRSLSDLVRAIPVLSPLLLFFGILGSCNLKKNLIILLWVLAVLLIPLLSFFQIEYPGWYTISPNRILFHVFAPLCILSGKFFADVEETLTRKKFLSFILLITLFSGGMHHLNLFNSFFPDPVSEVQMNPDDAFVMQWITDNTFKDTVILNTGPTVDCSSWIPVICKRKVVFPSFSGHRGDSCIEKVGAHKKRVDLKIIEYAPDSDTALQTLRKYNIEYVYIPAWKKRQYLELYPEPLIESPLYHPVVTKGDAYLFRVNYDEKPETTFFAVMNDEHITMEGDNLFQVSFSPFLSEDFQGAFFLHLEYTDNSYGQIGIHQDSTYIGTILKYKTGEEKSMIYPLFGSDKIDLYFYPEFDFFLERMTILCGLEQTIKVSDHIGLKGNWAIPESGSDRVIAPAEDPGLRIYLFNVCGGELIVHYEDTGYGNVDINISDILGRWNTTKIIYRENSGEIKEVHIRIDDYSVLVLGVYVYGEDFTIAAFQYENLQ